MKADLSTAAVTARGVGSLGLAFEKPFDEAVPPRPRSCPEKGFTLIELLAVIAIMVVLMSIVVPAVIGAKGSGDITKAVYDVTGALECARSYATAHNTYVWVGFFEENESNLTQATPAASGTGRIILSIVASKDGSMIYNPASLPATPASMAAGLVQVNKLVKIDNMHLATFPAVSGSGSTFQTRPSNPNNHALWQIGDTNSETSEAANGGSSKAPFQYPVGNPAPSAQYIFASAIQFSPRGEARLNDASQALQPVIEIGLQPTRGTVVSTANQNVAAVQITGIVANVGIYRK